MEKLKAHRERERERERERREREREREREQPSCPKSIGSLPVCAAMPMFARECEVSLLLLGSVISVGGRQDNEEAGWSCTYFGR